MLDLEGRSRSRWFSSYVEQLVERDAGQLLTRQPQAELVRAALDSCAARSAQELNKSAIAADSGMDFRTSERMLSLLEDLSIILRVPAWHPKRLKRLTSKPKVHLTDPGMAAYLLRIGPEQLGADPALIGPLFESLVASELATHIETAGEETDLFHLRTRDGHEVDAVLERQGAVVGIEVKSSTRVDRGDARGLVWMRERLGAAFLRGVILYSGSLPFRVSERIWALPLSSLWRSR